MTRPEELRDWAKTLQSENPHAPSRQEVAWALLDYAELLEDMQTLTSILNKWGP